MVKTVVRVAAGIATALGIAHTAFAQNTIAVTEFLNEPRTPEAMSEWIELYNYGTSSVNVGGWVLKDDDTDLATIPAATIAPNDYLVVARNKAGFETEWLAGVPNPRVVQFSGTFALGNTSDEIVLMNGATEVWRLAYKDDDNPQWSTWLTGTDFSRKDYGSKSATKIVRNGTDLDGTVSGYESCVATSDTLAFSAGNRDHGSPLRGHYGVPAPATAPATVDATSLGTAINAGIRGIAITDQTMERVTYQRAIPDCLAVCTGGSLRGVAGGLEADFSNWKTRVSTYHSMYGDVTQPRPPTLQFLRWARDTHTELFITVNLRGLVQYDPVTPGALWYYDTDRTTLAALAGDWVRYVNRIAQNYRTGDTIGDSRDNAILDSLVWNSAYPGDNWSKLLSPSEPAVKPVRYWEIGNEPNVSTAGAYNITNGYKVTAADYYDRYKAIVTAMKAEDLTIKVGPCGQNGSIDDQHLLGLLNDHTVPVDFISYHPYMNMRTQTTALDKEEYLGTVYSNQYERWKTIRDLIVASGRDPNSIEMVASEINVSNWSSNEEPQEGQMSHAIGGVETVFTFARLGLTASHYWIWPANAGDGTRYPNYMAYEMLRDNMGDRLLDFRTVDNTARVYTTRDSRTKRIMVWGVNFSETKTANVRMNITRIAGTTMTRHTLRNKTGATSLYSANLSPSQPGGPLSEVDWVTSSIAGTPEDFTLSMEPATVSLVIIEGDLQSSADNWSLYE